MIYRMTSINAVVLELEGKSYKNDFILRNFWGQFKIPALLSGHGKGAEFSNCPKNRADQSLS